MLEHDETVALAYEVVSKPTILAILMTMPNVSANKPLAWTYLSIFDHPRCHPVTCKVLFKRSSIQAFNLEAAATQQGNPHPGTEAPV
jgi:hypothetical protein